MLGRMSIPSATEGETVATISEREGLPLPPE
jgi:hypothetical protein